MKIGIFGDSFAKLKRNSTPSWVDILSEKYDITNHAISGSNLYYSIEEIKKHHEEYDKIIFVVTQPGRLQIADFLDVGEEKHKQFFSSIRDYKILNPSKVKNLWENAVKEAAIQYFMYLQNYKYDYYIHNLMLTDVQELRSDIVLIPSFKDSCNNSTIASMFEIHLNENAAWGLPDTSRIIEKYQDSRNCHMTAENNSIFADKAVTWINGAPVHIDLDDFVTTTNKDLYLKLL